jgi:hypothetical protein
MTEQTLTYDDRPWPDGPWMQEPDRVLWKDEATGLDCLVKRQPSAGHLCGYVAVPPGHPLYGSNYSIWADDTDDEPTIAASKLLDSIEVHGGLTYAAECDGDTVAGICHVAEPGCADEVWWFGFDCAHAWDLRPGNVAYAHLTPPMKGEVYRTVDYVKAECTQLAAQLAAVADV